VETARSNREDNPLAFHVFLVLYFCGGMALAVWGLTSMRMGFSAQAR